MRTASLIHPFLQCLLVAGICLQSNGVGAQPAIDRKKLVQRHNVINNTADTLASLTIGNGSFAYTADITGMQTFPEYYKGGIPLGTESEWGWHSFKDTVHYSFDETLKTYHLNGRDITYSVQLNQPARNKNAVNWFRQNPHRLQLGNWGFELFKKDGSTATINDIKNIHQELDLWSGAINSYFEVEGIPVYVKTYAHQDKDILSVQVHSALIRSGRLRLRLRFPYPTGDFADVGCNRAHADQHTSSVIRNDKQHAILMHQLDETKYFVSLQWTNTAVLSTKTPHDFELTPAANKDSFEVSCSFNENDNTASLPGFASIAANSTTQWKRFWSRGGAIDFSGSTDPRAFELERRIVLSEYLTKVQCAGHYPPQETGLTYNSWYGKPHLEMHWWHALHFALWGRIDLLEKSLSWYTKVSPKALDIAKRQGYDGLRWQKMTDNAGDESPSSVGAFLIWQQPHFIYFAELCYREHRDINTLQRYKDLVFATASFMASYAFYDSVKQRYILGKGLIPAQERFKPEETYNPTYELNYWYWALSVAQQWKQRLHLPVEKKWNDILQHLSALPQQNGLYLATESATDSYTNPQFRTDHPAVLGALGMLPRTKMMDTVIMKNTFSWIWKNWTWPDTWGWDFPLTAMTATRLGLPDKAIDALLMPIKTNTYLANGHNYQDDRLRLYLPGNGGLLTAVALMCAGYDNCLTNQPGIPKDGRWKVRWEGLRKMP